MQRIFQNSRKLEEKLGHFFHNGDYLLEALTHSTYAYEHRSEGISSNERLEFLGDAILDLVISEYLFLRPEIPSEGFMTQTRSMIVCERNLARLANDLFVGEALLLGKGEEMTGGRKKPSNLANAMEAIWGAIFLDAGYDATQKIILDLMSGSIRRALAGKMNFDYKSQLLEIIQSYKNGKLQFEILNEQGPVHKRIFTAGVNLNSKMIGKGTGTSKKEAEQEASRIALEYLKKDMAILDD